MSHSLFSIYLVTESSVAGRPLEIFVGLSTSDGSKMILSHVGNDPKVRIHQHLC